MGTKLYLRTDDGATLVCTMTAPQDNQISVPAGGTVAANTLNACTQASHTFPGVDANGDVAVTAFYGGLPDNALQVSLETGPTGAGNENLVLRLDVTGSMPSQTVKVLFATDGAGASITPNANDVVNLLNTDPLTAEVVTAVAGGTGLSDVVAAALTSLSGGLDDGARVTVLGRDVDYLVHRKETI